MYLVSNNFTFSYALVKIAHFAFIQRLCLKLNEKNQKRHKFFSGNDDKLDKIDIKTEHGGVSVGSSWLSKTFIDVRLSKNVVQRQTCDILTIN